MNVKQTIAEERKLRDRRRKALRRHGLCIDCGTNPATINKDNTQSVRCTDCRAAMRPKVFREAPPIVRVRQLIDRFDTKEFHTYAAAVTAIVEAADGKGVCTADIHKLLGYEHQGWTITVIKMIPGVMETQAGSVQRYRRDPNYREIPDAADDYADFSHLYPHRERGVYTERDLGLEVNRRTYAEIF